MFNKRSNNKTFTDEEVIEVIEQSSAALDDVLKYLYQKISTSLKPLVLSEGGSIDDVEDVVQDAVIVFYEKIKNKELRLHSTVLGYIYIVGKYIWNNKRRKKRKQLHLVDDRVKTEDAEDFDVELFDINEKAFVGELMSQLGTGCQKVLTQSIYEQLSMEQIAEQNGYKNEQIARNKKYKCLKQLRKIIESSERFQSMLKELYYDK